MTNYAVMQVGPGAQPVWYGDPADPKPFTMTNTSVTANIWVGPNQSVGPSDNNESTILSPGSYFSFDGSKPVYYVSADGPDASIQILPGVTSFFQPASLISLGGAKIFAQTLAPAQPPAIPVNSLWFDTANGSLQIWSGTAWELQQFNAAQLIEIATVFAAQVADGTLTTTQLAAAAGILGSQIAAETITGGNIAAGTITAANIAASAITAAKLAAGIIYAGIVNGTEIDGAIFKIKNSYGAVDLLLDSGTDALYVYADEGSALQGPIQASIAASAIADPVTGSNVPQGLYAQQLTLADQPAGPPSFGGASVYYSSVAGRPRYVSSFGVDSILERSAINVTEFQLGSATAPTIVSSALNYQPNEGAQSSEYEIEIDGIITTGGTTAALTFMLQIGGVTQVGGIITIGAVALQANSTYFIVLAVRLTLTDPASSTANVTWNGGISKSANVGSESSFPVINNSMQVVGTNSYTFDPSLGAGLAISAHWSAGYAGQNLTVHRTRITRRD